MNEAEQHDNRLPGWPGIEPHLNDAIASLRPADRAVILSRYFDGLSTAEAASELKISEAAVRTRLNRAIERLRTYFKRHELFFTATALAAVLTNRAAPATHAAPVHLVKLEVSGSLSGSPFDPSRLFHLLKGVQKQMLIGQIKVGSLISCAVIVAIGATDLMRAIQPTGFLSHRLAFAALPPESSFRRGASIEAHLAPIATEVRAYRANELQTIGLSDGLPVRIVAVTNEGSVVAERTTAVRRSDGTYTHYSTRDFIVSKAGITTMDRVSLAGTDGADRFSGQFEITHPMVCRNGRIMRLPLPHAFQSGFAASIASDYVGGCVSREAASFPCLWRAGKFFDLTSRIPGEYYGKCSVQEVDTRGDALVVCGSSANPVHRYFVVLNAGPTIDLRATSAIMNHRGQILLQRGAGAGKAMQVVVFSCATVRERPVASLSNQIQGQIAAFNDLGIILYQVPTPSGSDDYLISGQHVALLRMPPLQQLPIDSVQPMNNHSQFAIVTTGADKHLHVVLLAAEHG